MLDNPYVAYIPGLSNNPHSEGDIVLDNPIVAFIPDLSINPHRGPGPDLIGASTLIGDKLVNHAGEHLGDIKEIMLNTRTGSIAYAVVTHGGILSIGEKLFAVPWSILSQDTVHKCLVLSVAKSYFENAPGFDSENWPDMADQAWRDSLHSYYTKNL